MEYRVAGVYRVAWKGVRRVVPTRTEWLPLQTCLGRNYTAVRLVVVAFPAY